MRGRWPWHVPAVLCPHRDRPGHRGPALGGGGWVWPPGGSSFPATRNMAALRPGCAARCGDGRRGRRHGAAPRLPPAPGLVSPHARVPRSLCPQIPACPSLHVPTCPFPALHVPRTLCPQVSMSPHLFVPMCPGPFVPTFPISPRPGVPPPPPLSLPGALQAALAPGARDALPVRRGGPCAAVPAGGAAGGAAPASPGADKGRAAVPVPVPRHVPVRAAPPALLRRCPARRRYRGWGYRWGLCAPVAPGGELCGLPPQPSPAAPGHWGGTRMGLLRGPALLSGAASSPAWGVRSPMAPGGRGGLHPHPGGPRSPFGDCPRCGRQHPGLWCCQLVHGVVGVPVPVLLWGVLWTPCF